MVSSLYFPSIIFIVQVVTSNRFIFMVSYTAAKIGNGIFVDHATGVVIGETAIIGNRVSLMQVSDVSYTMFVETMSKINTT